MTTEKLYKILDDLNNSDKKYDISNISMSVSVPVGNDSFKDIVVYRIVAVRDFADVSAGDYGGFVQSRFNLDDLGTSWIYDDAVVCQHAKVTDQAVVKNHAVVCGDALIGGNTTVKDNSFVSGDTAILDFSRVSDNATVTGYAILMKDSIVSDSARILDCAVLSGSVRVKDLSVVCGHANVYGNITIKEESFVKDSASLNGNVSVRHSVIGGKVKVFCGKAAFKSSVVTDDLRFIGAAVDVQDSNLMGAGQLVDAHVLCDCLMSGTADPSVGIKPADASAFDLCRKLDCITTEGRSTVARVMYEIGRIQVEENKKK